MSSPSRSATVTLSTRRTRTIVTGAFAAAGLDLDEASRITDALLEAELREVPTHGILRAPGYLQRLRDGSLAPAGELSVKSVTGACSLIDAPGCLGYLPTWLAVESAVNSAREFGIGACGVRGISEFGRAAYYVARAVDLGAVAIVCQNTQPILAAPGASVATHGNNPIAFGSPGADAPIFDAALSHRSMGEIKRRAMLELPIPAEWGYLDETGRPTTDAARAAESPQQAVGGAKGFGIAVLVDLLAGVLTGAASGPAVVAGDATVGAMVIAISPRRLGLSPSHLADAFGNSARRVRAAGGRWPGDRASAAAERNRLAGSFEVPRAILASVVKYIPELASAAR
ncbi:MAG: Ldh family oxidoreductase [Cumulibacter sp.]